MPYKSISALPKSVKDNLSIHAQEIYLAAFNNAWEEYKESGKRKGEETREEASHKVGWAAVKKLYVKVGDKWQKR